VGKGARLPAVPAINLPTRRDIDGGHGAQLRCASQNAEWPGALSADAEIANLDELAGKYPAVAVDLRAIAASVC
jgi:hypothetical protein